ncbi:glucoamylase 1, partial [Candida albicans Ca6]
ETVSHKYENGAVYLTDLEKFTKEGAFAEEFSIQW